MSERPVEYKFTHKEVKYEDPAKGKDTCSDCVHFIESKSGCRCEVTRSPISPKGWCTRYSEEKQREASGR